MKPEQVEWLRDFLAAERGVTPADISSREVITRYRRRWFKFWLGLFSVLCIYLAVRNTVNVTAARGFVLLGVVMSLGLQVFSFRSSGQLTPGRMLGTKKELAEKLKISIGDISEAAVRDFDHKDARVLLRGMSIAALVSILTDLALPSIFLEALILAIFYSTGALAWTVISARRR
jgi:hypothetical protein